MSSKKRFITQVMERKYAGEQSGEKKAIQVYKKLSFPLLSASFEDFYRRYFVFSFYTVELLSFQLLNSLPLSAIGHTEDCMFIYTVTMSAWMNVLQTCCLRYYIKNLIWLLPGAAERVAGWGLWEGILCRSYRRAGKRVWITEHSSSLENHVSSLWLFAQSFSFSLSAFLIFWSQPAPRIGLTEDFWVIVLGLCASCQAHLPRLTWQLRVQGCGWHPLSY